MQVITEFVYASKYFSGEAGEQGKYDHIIQ